ncbi:PD-(D/E)XK nuclease family protein [uncultured Maribacter sp.]|uniref:PD-(D/E)XK nuclease family protein n=1 Tax=uncultured Maribacter sp. TaxID=431308 RepID=UPI002613D8FA|nr:PD-(D/E)XK nuclease family protein [uncultured Maribacter sp.]
MNGFLEEVLDKILSQNSSLSNHIFILPSKRAGTFLKNSIAKKATKTEFAPEIWSIETFIEKISGLSYASNLEQLFSLYNTYLKSKPKEIETFYSFSKWGQTLLQDFNEIDRYLIDTKKLFSNLSAIQEISHWSPEAPKTQLMEDYLLFWNNLDVIYKDFNASLLNKNKGHQGLVYRTACSKLKSYLKENKNKTFVFLGFNALNESESIIIQQILEQHSSDIFWDIDNSFLKDPVHDAGLFLRDHKKNWSHFNSNDFKGVSNYYSESKKIEIIGTPKNISQAKYVGNLLKEISKTSNNAIKNTAVILADESLLNPILNSIPEEINSVNITMGYSLEKTPLASFFQLFFELYIKRNTKGWFYSNLLDFLSHPTTTSFLNSKEENNSNLISNAIKNKNWSYITPEKIISVAKDKDCISTVFQELNFTPLSFTKRCLLIISKLKDIYTEQSNSLALEYLYRFNSLFNQLNTLLVEHHYMNDLKSLLSLYNELLSSETLDFRGDPIEGLQIMGMLESRNLDFETVIITSVNEGILPSGKSNNSFIPFDLKIAHGLPTYKEKDAVYTYHFYRILQRAKNVYLIYNTEPDVLEGGEKSRLITQLLTDENKIGDITEKIATPNVVPSLKEDEIIEKDVDLMSLIKNHATNGFSPTSLSNYIRNPIDFYKRNLLKIDDLLAVEETVAANTFGTIVHDTLEDLYTPFVGKTLEVGLLHEAKKNIEALVKKHFAKTYAEGDIKYGKNLIAYNVILRYIERFIHLEIKQVKQNTIKIIALEQNLKVSLNFPELDYPIVLKGKLDRIDEENGTLRIIDYKTGRVEPKNVKITNWEDCITDYSYSKAFQLLCYSVMFNAQNPISEIQAGIITFKNLNAGILKFNTPKGPKKSAEDSLINKETLDLFLVELKRLILEICNPNIPFKEKEV